MIKFYDMKFPADFFEPPVPRPESWPDNPELRRAVEWLKTFMPDAEWRQRREKAARRLYSSAMGIADDAGDGRFFNAKDSFGWYLFLGEALLDHIGNYDYIFGARVVPVLQAIGRDLNLLLQIEGIDARVRRMITKDQAQPNGCLFELLVAACYRRAGAHVAFVDEQPGQRKTHDMNVSLNGKTWAVECKRMEVGEYGERERLQIGKLWRASAAHLAEVGKNTLCKVSFKVTIQKVPADYLVDKVIRWLASGREKMTWDDGVSSGEIYKLDLRPLQKALAADFVLGGSTRFLELLTGRYVRNAHYSTLLKIKAGDNPRYVDACDLAVILHWESLSSEAIDGKARDIRKKLSEATAQLPNEQPGIVHIGFEAVEGDRVERLRHEKIITTANEFDPEGKQLEYVCCHYFVPESPPDQCWAFDETTQWCTINPKHQRPLEDIFLVLPSAANNRTGPHWQE